jgi:hypothetical protein
VLSEEVPGIAVTVCRLLTEYRSTKMTMTTTVYRCIASSQRSTDLVVLSIATQHLTDNTFIVSCYREKVVLVNMRSVAKVVCWQLSLPQGAWCSLTARPTICFEVHATPSGTKAQLCLRVVSDNNNTTRRSVACVLNTVTPDLLAFAVFSVLCVTGVAWSPCAAGLIPRAKLSNCVLTKPYPTPLYAHLSTAACPLLPLCALPVLDEAQQQDLVQMLYFTVVINWAAGCSVS